jgi:hypothetical protein
MRLTKTPLKQLTNSLDAVTGVEARGAHCRSRERRVYPFERKGGVSVQRYDRRGPGIGERRAGLILLQKSVMP